MKDRFEIELENWRTGRMRQFALKGKIIRCNWNFVDSKVSRDIALIEYEPDLLHTYQKEAPNLEPEIVDQNHLSHTLGHMGHREYCGSQYISFKGGSVDMSEVFHD